MLASNAPMPVVSPQLIYRASLEHPHHTLFIILALVNANKDDNFSRKQLSKGSAKGQSSPLDLVGLLHTPHTHTHTHTQTNMCTLSHALSYLQSLYIGPVGGTCGSSFTGPGLVLNSKRCQEQNV